MFSYSDSSFFHGQFLTLCYIFDYELSCTFYFCICQVLRDVPKARREVDLHWRASACKHIVNIMDVHENMYGGHKCLLVVMEW